MCETIERKQKYSATKVAILTSNYIKMMMSKKYLCYLDSEITIGSA